MGAIDADAHVIERVQTWSYLEGDERRFTPQLMKQTSGEALLSNEGVAVPDFWVIEGRAHGMHARRRNVLRRDDELYAEAFEFCIARHEVPPAG